MLQQYDCVKMHFTAPLHLSRGRMDYDKSENLFHSDALISALFVAARQLGAAESEILDMLDAVRVSSAFPFWKDEYFFPKPMARISFDIKEVPVEKQGKPFKNIRYLGKTWFEKAINGTTGLIEVKKHLSEKAFLSDYAVKPIFKPNVTQRVTILPDHSGDSTPFYTERLFFEPYAGLFILAKWENEQAKGLFQRAFRLLGDLGIGTDRSVGNGFFEPKFTTLSLNVPEAASHQMALGLYLPNKEELMPEVLENSTWGLIKRGGYIAGAKDPEHTSLRKRSVYMFEEGSVFPNISLSGKRIDLKPDWQGLDHAIWREGRPIFINFQKTA